MPRYGMVIDLDRCMGCRACMEACKVENNTPEATFWMYVFRFEEGEYPDTRISFTPRPCMHCDNPPCVKVCPTGARYKRGDGLVATNVDTCNGCRYCAVACPYGVNFFNWKDPKKNQYLDWSAKDLLQITKGDSPPYKNPDLDRAYGKEKRRIAGGGHRQGVIEKCTFCVQRVEKALKPACVNVCPVFALEFGDLDDSTSAVSRRLGAKRSFRLREDFGTQPRVHYVGKARPGTGARQIEKPGRESV
ncbi:MAG: 4Fe-4S dicluster domain-containing protein [Candidatus Methylomirabilales bacterium]